MDTQINTYHKYLNLPFNIDPLSDFTQQGDKALHYYINDSSFTFMKEWLNNLELKLFLTEVFYTPPFGKIPIHTDHASYTNHAKINITWGPDEGVTQWWKSDKVIKKYLKGIGESTTETHRNLWAEEKDCELLYEANTNRPSLVNVGVLHGTNNPTSQGRWTLCFVPKKDGEYIHWDSALKIFKNYLDD